MVENLHPAPREVRLLFSQNLDINGNSVGDTAAAEIRDAASRHLWHNESNRFCRMIFRNDSGGLEMDTTCDASLWGLFAFGL